MSIFIWIAAIGILLLLLVIVFAVRWFKPSPPKLKYKLGFTTQYKQEAFDKIKLFDSMGYETKMIENPVDPYKRWQVWIAKEVK